MREHCDVNGALAGQHSAPCFSTAGHTKPVSAEDCQVPAHVASVDTLDHVQARAACPARGADASSNEARRPAAGSRSAIAASKCSPDLYAAGQQITLGSRSPPGPVGPLAPGGPGSPFEHAGLSSPPWPPGPLSPPSPRVPASGMATTSSVEASSIVTRILAESPPRARLCRPSFPVCRSCLAPRVRRSWCNARRRHRLCHRHPDRR